MLLKDRFEFGCVTAISTSNPKFTHIQTLSLIIAFMNKGVGAGHSTFYAVVWRTLQPAPTLGFRIIAAPRLYT